MTTHRELTSHHQAELLRAEAQTALDGRDPDGLPIRNSSERAVALASVAIAHELADLSDRVLCTSVQLDVIAESLAERAAAVDFTEAELTVARGEITRTDTKASVMLAGLAIVAGPLVDRYEVLLAQPWPIAVLGGIAAASAAGSAWLLLDVVLPRLIGRCNANFLHYAKASDAELADALGAGADRRGELRALSVIAKAKFVRLTHAGRLLKAAGALFAVTTILATLF
ncbi:Pycsar system effector family protein [Streptomyces sp. NPDC047315]|uniref:Pycsar system effector family protein n=1 Tax=Streptomyces sp. NPDC047315 TaxID=3155142 RepID=UPI0033C1AF54